VSQCVSERESGRGAADKIEKETPHLIGLKRIRTVIAPSLIMSSMVKVR